MIELHQFEPAFELPNPSPFCMKVEIFLRLARLEYKTVVCPDPRKAPLGKLPFIRDGEALVSDSGNIVEYLVKKYGTDLDAGLSEDERALAHAFRRMLEEHSYFGLLYARWIDTRSWPTTRKTFFATIPPGLRRLLSALVQKKIIRDTKGHGLGLHAGDEIYRRIGEDLGALAAFLDRKAFFMGAEPTSVDATVYGFVGNMWEASVPTPLRELVGQHPNLIAYCARMRQRCFGAQAPA